MDCGNYKSCLHVLVEVVFLFVLLHAYVALYILIVHSCVNMSCLFAHTKSLMFHIRCPFDQGKWCKCSCPPIVVC